ncbi:hypothetical protein E2C01_098672 [Portunus trituberculatus]|uniref:Uncharacterized protein n=1 Tax=Portunus trituberculatus TaxID=210409 RepID=A0A5B7KER2_PORTR|nr:hypothetical protein [Portunus trituberculatus]
MIASASSPPSPHHPHLDTPRGTHRPSDPARRCASPATTPPAVPHLATPLPPHPSLTSSHTSSCAPPRHGPAT